MAFQLCAVLDLQEVLLRLEMVYAHHSGYVVRVAYGLWLVSLGLEHKKYRITI